MGTSQQNNSNHVISLIGMPGSGKSTVGALLAERTGLAFVDTDTLIQQRENATLAQIIAASGNENLLEIEKQVLLEMPIGPSVISTGGSVVYSRTVMDRLVSSSTVVYLQARLETVTHRISLAPDRGIASPGNKTIDDVYLERVPLYERHAQITVDVDEDSPEEIVGQIMSKL